MAQKDLWAGIEESPQLWQAVTAAFAVLSAADDKVLVSELDRFREWLGDKTQSDDVKKTALADFDQLTASLLSDYESGMTEARARLVAIKENPEERDMVIEAARTAIVADLRLHEREEVAMRELCDILGVDPAQG